MVNAIDPVGANPAVQDIAELPQIPTAVPTDTVQFSIPAQVQILEQQGFTLTEIASQLGISAAEAANDLDVPPVVAPAQVTKR